MTTAAGAGDLHASPETRWRFVALVVLTATTFAIARYAAFPAFSSDLDQLWHAAHALRNGDNPYAVVGPGRAFEWGFPLFYPLPAVVLAIPFSFLPLPLARITFAALSAGALGYAIAPRWRVRWPLLLSASYFLAISRNQWSPLILAAFWLPALGFVIAAKPNAGMLAILAQRRRAAVLMLALAASITALSVAIRPTWIREWLEIVRALPNQRIALLQPGGFVLLAALLLWRRRDGRILLAAALVPLTPSVYDVLPLFALCRTLRQSLALAAFTHALQWSVIALGPYPAPAAAYESLARMSVYLALIPALAIAFFNHRAGREDAGSAPRPGEAGEAGAPAGTKAPLDQILLAVVVIALGVELWILFRGS